MMSPTARTRLSLVCLASITVWGVSLLLAQDKKDKVRTCDPPELTEPVTEPVLLAQEKKDKEKVRRVELVRNVFLEVEGEKETEKRRVVLSATICLQKGALELLMTRKDTKEHEAVITIDADAREIHKALLLAKAEAGSPVKFDPRYMAAHGQPIRITVKYFDKDKTVSVDAKQFIRNVNTKKVLETDWVFAGSKLIQNPLDKERLIFLANDGDIVCVSNFESALLDLPIKSSKEAADLVWEANTEKIPPMGTKVTVILEPMPKK